MAETDIRFTVRGCLKFCVTHDDSLWWGLPFVLRVVKFTCHEIDPQSTKWGATQSLWQLKASVQSKILLKRPQWGPPSYSSPCWCPEPSPTTRIVIPGPVSHIVTCAPRISTYTVFSGKLVQVDPTRYFPFYLWPLLLLLGNVCFTLPLVLLISLGHWRLLLS